MDEKKKSWDTPKEFLSRYRDLGRSMESKKEQILELRREAVSLSQAILGDRVQTSRTSDRVAKAVSAIADLIADIERSIEKRCAAMKEIEEVIDSLPDGLQQEVLRRRYLLGQSFDQIAEKLTYSRMQINRIHGKALEEIKKQWEDGKNDSKKR